MKQKQIELLIYLLEDIRKVTLKGVSGITKEQLFQEPVKGEYSIGSYLMHLVECDLGWLRTLTGKEPDEELKRRAYYAVWFDCPEEFAKPPKEPIEIDEYIDTITKCRAKLIEHIKTLTDEDLEGTVILHKNFLGEVVNKKYIRKWIITFLIQHEAHTRGQMFMLMRMAGFKAKGENN